MDAETKVLVRRFSPTNTLEQPVFLFNVNTGTLSISEETHASGWLVDNECVISGSKTVIFYENDDEYIAIGDRNFRLRDKEMKLHHKRGAFISKLSLIDSKGATSITYLTPWWRLLWDDGSHTDMQFSLDYLSRLWVKKANEISAKKPALLE